MLVSTVVRFTDMLRVKTLQVGEGLGMKLTVEQQHALMRLHAGLPRQGPGSDDNTRAMLRLLPELPENSLIYDLGCGPGRASLVVAKFLNRRIIAVDLQETFLATLREEALKSGLAHLIETRCGDMAALHEKQGSIDLIWSEGAIYCIGFDAALSAWRPFLANGGIVACSELSWLLNNPSPEPVAFWRKNYSGMRTVSENILAAERGGYECFEHFTLPVSCWWDEYYNPWLDNIERLRDDAAHDEVLREFWLNAVEEIDIFRRFHQEYGYEFYLLRLIHE